MVAFEEGSKPVEIPIYGSDQVTDVTGAGDTVIATFTAAIAAGADTESAARIGELRRRNRGDEAWHGDGFAEGIAERDRGAQPRSVASMSAAQKIVDRDERCRRVCASGAPRANRSFSPTDASICCTWGTCAICTGQRRLADAGGRHEF